MRDNVKARRLIRSKWFQSKFGDLFQLSEDQDTKIRVDNMQGGYRVITSVEGTVLGEGAGIIISDDINDLRNTSETVLQSALDFYTDVLPTRYNDFKTGRFVNIQQRVDERDVSGYIMSNEADNFVLLVLPMEYEVDRKCVTVPLKSTGGKKWEDPRTVEGELLFPARVGPKELARLKASLGSEYAIAGQLQQRPAPAAGGIIKKAWFKIWDQNEPPRLEYVLQSWDTAMTAEKHSAYSAVTTWGIFNDDHGIPNIILLAANRKKMEFPELYDCVLRMSQDYLAFEPGGKINKGRKPDLIVIEDKATGVTLCQQLSRLGINPVRFNPNKYGDKINRVRRVTHLLEAGRVWVPGRSPDYKKMREFADKFVAQCLSFPNAESRDWVDSMAQALLRLSVSGWVYHPSDEVAQPRKRYVEQERPPLY
jgi:predicted phage terminase large subunit-like protein